MTAQLIALNCAIENSAAMVTAEFSVDGRSGKRFLCVQIESLSPAHMAEGLVILSDAIRWDKELKD